MAVPVLTTGIEAKNEIDKLVFQSAPGCAGLNDVWSLYMVDVDEVFQSAPGCAGLNDDEYYATKGFVGSFNQLLAVPVLTTVHQVIRSLTDNRFNQLLAVPVLTTIAVAPLNELSKSFNQLLAVPVLTTSKS